MLNYLVRPRSYNMSRIIYILFILAFSTQCTNAKINRKLSSNQNLCFNKDITSEKLAKRIQTGECNNLDFFCDLNTVEGLHQIGKIRNLHDSKFYLVKEYKGTPLENKNKVYTNQLFPWQYSMTPFKIIKKEAYYTRHLEKSLGLAEYNFDFFKRKITPLTSVQKIKIKDLILDAFKEHNAQAEVKDMNSLASRSFACGFLTIKNLLDCQNAISTIIQHVDQAGSLTVPEANIALLSEESYRVPLQNMAIKIDQWINNDEAPEGDIFDDLFTEFKDSGLNEKTSYEHTWNVMAVLATGGANYIVRAKDFAVIDINPITVFSIAKIAQGIPYLSFLTKNKGHFYGLPKSVNVSCDNGKHYHFWMSSYLAWKANQLGHTPKGSAAAAYSIFKGYQFMSKGAYRDPYRNLSIKSFEGINNIQRSDMAYSAAGIKFALNIVNNKKDEAINLDQAVLEIFKNSEDVSPLGYYESNSLYQDSFQKAYLLWFKIFAPDSPYKLLIK